MFFSLYFSFHLYSPHHVIKYTEHTNYPHFPYTLRSQLTKETGNEEREGGMYVLKILFSFHFLDFFLPFFFFFFFVFMNGLLNKPYPGSGNIPASTPRFPSGTSSALFMEFVYTFRLYFAKTFLTYSISST